MRTLFIFAAIAVTLGPTGLTAAPQIQLEPEKKSGLYTHGEKIVWDVKVSGDEAAPITSATYTLRQGGAKTIGEGQLTFTGGATTLETVADEPGTILAEVKVPGAAGQPAITAFGGAAVDPGTLKPSMPSPDDFDAFWKSKLASLDKIPPNPVLEKGDSGRADVDYWKVTLDNVDDAHVHGQLARPTKGDKFPAMLVLQWAGVYPLEKPWVTDPASDGWLVLNIMAHDLPIDQPRDFYQQQASGPLKNYPGIGRSDRDKSYFLHMVLGCQQAVRFLAGRPDWDGRTLVVTGTSQGGFQSLATAALNPRITAMIVLVPAGCDHTGALVGRKPGWPYWLDAATDDNRKALQETSRYYDGVNFAARVKCPSLLAFGLIDTTAPPSGVFAAANQISAPKELFIMPERDHHGSGPASDAAYNARIAVWKKAILAGAPLPPPDAPNDLTPPSLQPPPDAPATTVPSTNTPPGL